MVVRVTENPIMFARRAACLAAVERVVAAQVDLRGVLRVELLEMAVAELALLVLLVTHGLTRGEAFGHAGTRLLLLGRRLLRYALGARRLFGFARHKVRVGFLLCSVYERRGSDGAAGAPLLNRILRASREESKRK